jgi:signal peptidase I
MRSRRRGAGWLALALAVVAVALAVRASLASVFVVPTGSMRPTIRPGEWILVSRIAFELHPIEVGDVVVLRRPARDPGPARANYLVKRVVATPGEVVASRDGHVVVNGRVQPEPYLPAGVTTVGIIPQRVPPGEYFVLGDDRSDSIDSRIFGPVPGSCIVGEVVAVVWPPSAWGLVRS